MVRKLFSLIAAGQFMLLLSLSAAAPVLKINGVAVSPGQLTVSNQEWTFQNQWRLKDPKNSPEELQLNQGNWRKHQHAGHIVGYNGDITLKINVPGGIKTLQAGAAITNYADRRERGIYISYSLDGVKYLPLTEGKFTSGSKKIEKQTALPANGGKLWVRYGRTLEKNDSNGRYGFVLFNKISLKLQGSEPAQPETKACLQPDSSKTSVPEIKLNGSPMPIQIAEGANRGWTFSRDWKFNDRKKSPEELQLSQNNWQQHPQAGHIVGYNGDITIKIRIPAAIKTLKASATMTNYADGRKRNMYISYSLDNLDFRPLAQSDFQGGSKTIDGQIELPANKGYLWIQYGRKLEKGDQNGHYGFVLFNSISLSLSGSLPTPEEYQKAVRDATASRRMQDFFPTGVFWPWERTRRNADKAGMEVWQFAEAQMKQLKEYGCNTIWFVNLSSSYYPRILMMAEKYGLQVLVNPYMIYTFYHGLGSLQQADRLARSTVASLSDFPALRGFILVDEPGFELLEVIDHYYNLLHKYDPRRDTTCVITNRFAMTFLRESDMPVICSDLYYFGHDRSTNIPNPSSVSQGEISFGLEGYNTQAELHGKHHWFMGQMFGDIWGRSYVKNGKAIVYPGSYLHWRMPTCAETRWQVWEAVRNGSKGVFFYVLLPPRQLQIPPEQVKPGTPDAELVEDMDRSAKYAKGWKSQWLTEKMMEFDPGEGIVQYGGAPTPQMGAMGEAFKMLRKHEKLLISKKRAKFPVFFSDDKMTNTATFDQKDGFRYGVVVNRNVNKDRTVTVLLPANVKAVTDLKTGTSLPITVKDKHFKSVSLRLAAGDGTILKAEFIDGIAGMSLCREKFDQQTFHRVRLHGNSEIFHKGNFGVDAQRFIRLKKDGDSRKPVFTVRNLTNFRTSTNTFSLNLNGKYENGTTYCQIKGRLNSAVIKAVSDQHSKGKKTNVSHLALDNFKEAEQTDAGARKLTIQTKNFRVPAVVPVGTTSLEVYLTEEYDNVSEINIWFVPKVK